MANALYSKGKEHILNGDIDIDGNALKVMLVATAYTPNLTTHETLADVSSYRIGTDQSLANVTKTLGVVDADDVTWTAVDPGSTGGKLVIYVDSGVPSSSYLIALFDTITSFPVVTNGGDITVQWDNGPYKIFSL